NRELELLRARKELAEAETKKLEAEVALKNAATANDAPPPAYEADTHPAPQQPINVHVHLPAAINPAVTPPVASAPPRDDVKDESADANTTTEGTTDAAVVIPSADAKRPEPSAPKSPKAKPADKSAAVTGEANP